MPAYVWALIHAGPAAWAVYHALLYKRDPRSAMGWIMICLFVPFAGPLAYFFSA
jgi:cardiolipin synthase